MHDKQLSPQNHHRRFKAVLKRRRKETHMQCVLVHDDELYYLIHNDPDWDGGHPKSSAKLKGYRYAWCLGPDMEAAMVVNSLISLTPLEDQQVIAYIDTESYSVFN